MLERKIDSWMERRARRLYRRTSRRSLLGRLGAWLVGGAILPLLPVARGVAQEGGHGGAGGKIQADDPTACNYWRYCAIDGFLCACCGGSASRCPPGTEPSPITWIGTCRNPQDGRHYVISYNDCCGKTSCGRCFCNRNEGDKPVYVPYQSNDINWCLGTQVGEVYHCSTAVVIGVAES